MKEDQRGHQRIRSAASRQVREGEEQRNTGRCVTVSLYQRLRSLKGHQPWDGVVVVTCCLVPLEER